MVMKMIMQNFSELEQSISNKKALKILEAGLFSALPENFIKKFVTKNCIKTDFGNYLLSKYSRIYIVAYGKAADSMAKLVDEKIKTDGGIVVIPKGTKTVVGNKKFQIIRSSHPIPDKSSIRASKIILNFLKQMMPTDFVIFLVSGGGSALLSLPEGISLEEKKIVTKELLACGAKIQEINCVRKHLSLVKGGKLVEHLKCEGVALVMSDVGDNDLSSISSGCTYFDNTTFSDALQIIKKYRLEKKIPKNVVNRLRLGSSGKISETPKKPRIKNQIIASNKECLSAMKKKSEKFGFSTKVFTVYDDVEVSAKKIITKISTKKNTCLVFGGEPTVNIKGKGKGGRNQELVLRILKNLQGNKKNLIIASMGTDGVDGNTKYAGAITDLICFPVNQIDDFLKSSNSNAFFKKSGGLIKTGPTHTNLLDIGLILNF